MGKTEPPVPLLKNGSKAIVYVRRNANAQTIHMDAVDAPFPGPQIIQAGRPGQSVNGHQRGNIVPPLIAKGYVSRDDRKRSYALDPDVTNFNCAVKALLEFGDEDLTGDSRQRFQRNKAGNCEHRCQGREGNNPEPNAGSRQFVLVVLVFAN